MIELPLFILGFLRKLIAVRFADRSAFVRPAIPNVRVQVAHVIALFLPDPKQFVDTRFERRAPNGEDGKFFLQIVPVYDAEFFYRVRGRAVFPAGAHGKFGIPNARLDNLVTVVYK